MLGWMIRIFSSRLKAAGAPCTGTLRADSARTRPGSPARSAERLRWAGWLHTTWQSTCTTTTRWRATCTPSSRAGRQTQRSRGGCPGTLLVPKRSLQPADSTADCAQCIRDSRSRRRDAHLRAATKRVCGVCSEQQDGQRRGGGGVAYGGGEKLVYFHIKLCTHRGMPARPRSLLAFKGPRTLPPGPGCAWTVTAPP